MNRGRCGILEGAFTRPQGQWFAVTATDKQPLSAQVAGKVLAGVLTWSLAIGPDAERRA